LPAVSTSTSDEFVMPGALRNRPFPLPGFGLALGITILPLFLRKDSAMFHSSKFHLDQVDESYPEHFRAALGVSLRRKRRLCAARDRSRRMYAHRQSRHRQGSCASHIARRHAAASGR
jgi:hypothetical protein